MNWQLTHTFSTTPGCCILKRQASSVRSSPFAALSQITFKSPSKVLRDTLTLWLHLVPDCVSESLKNNTLRAYPSEESEVDCSVMRALVPGVFGSAVLLSVRRTVRRRLCEERRWVVGQHLKGLFWEPPGKPPLLTAVPDHRTGGFGRYRPKCRHSISDVL